MKTYRDVILETVKYYENHDRGYNAARKRCTYYSKTGATCAVGRCLNDPAKAQDVAVNNFHLYDLKPEYSHIKKINFWVSLQRFHDTHENWQRSPNKKNVLTDEGKENLEMLLETFKN